MALLTRDQILTAEDLKTETVECPEWGGDVLVRTLTGAERDRFEAGIASQKGGKPNLENLRASLAVATVVGEDGEPLFTRADIAKLGMKSAKPLDRIFTVARNLAGLNEKDVEEMVEDFDADPSGSSSSD